MARLIPAKPPSSAPASVLRMFRLFRKLGDDFVVWHRIADRAGPEFLAVWRDRHAFLIQVADTTQQLADTAIQPSLLDEAVSPDRLGAERLGEFGDILRQLDPGESLVRCLVVFPNVDDSTIDQVERLRDDDTGVTFLGLKQTPEGHFERYLVAQAAGPLGATFLVGLRQRFTPESVVREVPARAPLLRRLEAGALPPAFLDLDQESLAKLDLELPPEAEGAVLAAGTRLVTGPAGCGKSLVLLHRALIAAKFHPRARLLILTHNRPINGELRRRALKTAPEGARVQWLTFFQWARKFVHVPGSIISARNVSSRLRGLMENHGPFGSLTADFLAEEIGYLRDLGVESADEYLALERKGRLTGLSSGRKEAVWRLLEAYRADLAARGESDWHELALAFRDFAKAHPHRMPKFHFIFIDEAQFFAKVWFQAVLEALAPGSQLFLAADTTQGFLKRRESWLAAGIDVRGRSNRLAKPYRSTRAILDFATRLLGVRRPLHPAVSPDDLDPPSAAELATTDEAGEAPHFLETASPQDAIARAAAEVERLATRAPWLAGSVLLLHADAYATRGLASAVSRKIGGNRVADLNNYAPQPADPFCKISNLHAATGLEAAVVVLLGLGNLLESEADPRLDPDARAELAASHTRLLYMACTRAGSRLVIIDSSPRLRELVQQCQPAPAGEAEK